MNVMASSQLKEIRESIGLSQEGLARRTRGLSSRTIRNAETGQRVTFDTASQILEALNSALVEVGKPKVTLDDLVLTLR
jgi:transcriptional regulator with XRE-family HTH domain